MPKAIYMSLEKTDLPLVNSEYFKLLVKQKRAPIAKAHSYYRSKIFNANCGINPLVAAANPLLTLAGKLRETTNYSDLSILYQDLVHEIKAFEHNAQAQGYRSETILIARYALCVTLDEIFLEKNWAQEWQTHLLLMAFHQETCGGERFFIILEHLNEDPSRYIDVLELFYLCLSLGFKGKFRDPKYGTYELEQLNDDLYQAIRWQRGTLNKGLLIQASYASVRQEDKPEKNEILLWPWICFLIAIVSITLYLNVTYLFHINLLKFINL